MLPLGLRDINCSKLLPRPSRSEIALLQLKAFQKRSLWPDLIVSTIFIPLCLSPSPPILKCLWWALISFQFKFEIRTIFSFQFWSQHCSSWQGLLDQGDCSNLGLGVEDWSASDRAEFCPNLLIPIQTNKLNGSLSTIRQPNPMVWQHCKVQWHRNGRLSILQYRIHLESHEIAKWWHLNESGDSTTVPGFHYYRAPW